MVVLVVVVREIEVLENHTARKSHFRKW